MKPFEIERVFDAPRERVWKAWTDAAALKQWFSPAGFRVLTNKLDLRVGGTFHYGMLAPDGKEVWGKFLYREIVPPRKLVFLVQFSDPQGGTTRHPWSPEWPLHMLSTVTLEEQGKGTRVTVHWTPHEATAKELKAFEEGRDSIKGGWSGTFDQLARYLSGA